MKFAGRYLNQENKSFDWKSFKAAIDDYDGVDLTFDKYKNQTINQSTSTVDTMVTKIAQFLIDALGAVIDQQELTATILATFTNLKVNSESGFADYSKDASNTSFTYRIVFAIANKNIPSDFYSLVTTIKLTADIHEKSGWFGLTHSSSQNFAAEIDALELVVSEGFKAPPRK